MTTYQTAESVTAGHPDKLCDLIADTILDACLAKDPAARIACEVLATRGYIVVAGEITTLVFPDVFDLVRKVLCEVGYDPADYQIECRLHRQSPDIAAAVDGQEHLGAGDQGVMVGYAVAETAEYMPLATMLAQRLTRQLTAYAKSSAIPGIGPDGKAQVTVEYEDGKPLRVDTVVLSVQHSAEKDGREMAKELMENVLAPALRCAIVDCDTQFLINPSGRFVAGGLEADTGLTGRKLMVDTYGPLVSHGGGAFSGKDPTKVDRSGAYMARYVAKNLVAAGLCAKCQVTLAYAIGQEQPVMVEVDSFGTCPFCADDCLALAVRKAFDLTPAGIIQALQLQRPLYARTAVGGHFGRPDLPWERTDKIKQLMDMVL